MRTVANFHLTSAQKSADVASALSACREAVDAWVDLKGTLKAPAGGDNFELNTGGRATLERAEVGSSAYFLELTQATPYGRFRTSVQLASDANSVVAFISLGAEGRQGLIGPTQFDAYCPKVVHHLIAGKCSWAVGKCPVALRPLKFSGKKDGAALASVLWDPDRTLPLVVVSDSPRGPLSNLFSQRLALDLAGLALIVDVDSAAAWELTDLKGSAWSCHSGAVRLYWPFHSLTVPKDHPLWIRDSLVVKHRTAAGGALWLRSHLRRRLFGVSALTLSEPPIFGSLRDAPREAELRQLRTTLEDKGEWQQLAESYASENSVFRSRIADLTAENADLRVQVTNMQDALRFVPGAESPDLQADNLREPTTVEEAVYLAKERYSHNLLFGADVAEGVRGIAPDAGPPTKILRYLEQLSELNSRRTQGALGSTAIGWLRDRNVAASDESDTVTNSQEERRRRTWDDGAKRRYFAHHLKPSDVTASDRCVRIYFDFDDERKLTLIGWIGRHP